MRSALANWLGVSATLLVGALVGCSDLGSSSAPTRSSSRTTPAGDAVGFERVASGRVRPVVSAPRSSRAPEVELPERLGDPALIRAPGRGMSVEVTLLDTAPVLGETERGSWVHRGGAPGGGDVVWRPIGNGVEDHVTFESRPAREALRYRLDLNGVAGLRLVSGSLELLDAEGTPRLRMNRPWLSDRDGRSHWASVRLEGCHTDSDPRPPWGRQPVSPGSRQCEVTLDWSASQIEYPAIVDPAWTSTGSMAEKREFHGAARLDDGRVLVAGGWKGDWISGAEIFDPTTSTFATTSSMSISRAQQGFVLLPNGTVLACGGWGLQSSAEIWDPTTGLWSATGSMAVPRTNAFVALRLASGKVLVAGGSTSLTTELYDPTTGTFTPTGNLNAARYFDFSGTLLKDGRVFVAGSGSSGTFLASGEIYDPATGKWTLTADMKFGRTEHLTILLPDGRVLVPGGVAGDAIKYSDIYDPVANSWTPTPNLKIARRTFAGGLLNDGRVLVVGGEIVAPPFYTETAEIYDPVANTWTWASSMAHGRYAPSFTLLTDGSVLVAGGYSDSDGYLDDAQVFRLQADGATCSIDADCTSGHCVDGVCCATTCSQLCQACSAALKTSGPNGVCGPAKLGTIEASCAAQPGSPCGYIGSCDGQGSCSFAAQGVNCAPKQCSSGSLASFACNGLGACAQTSVSCAPFVCGTATTCATSCGSDAECAASAWCDAGVCKSDSNAGSACTSASQCKSGYCVDGFCCDKACDSGCEACSAAKTGGSNGACQPVTTGTDPNDDCPDDGASSCSRDGTCNGAGACRKYALGVTCGAPACAGNTPATFACNGSGTCVAALGSDCGAYLCSGSACTTACTGDAQCAPGAHCVGGSCVPLAKLGDKCGAATECSSGFCADGYCCNAACNEQCEACDVQGGEGHCVPVAGQPHGSRLACSGGDPGNPCGAAACDGIERTSCQDFVGSSVSCRAASCSAGVATLAGVCDGTGQCPAAATRECAPYGCAGNTCGASCESDSECDASAVCDLASGKCVTPAKCADADTVEAPNGGLVACAPFRCENGACLTSCTSVKDCAASYVCGASGVCQKPTPAAEADSSSGCASAPARGSPAPYRALGLFLLGLPLLLRMRARRHARRPKR